MSRSVCTLCLVAALQGSKVAVIVSPGGDVSAQGALGPAEPEPAPLWVTGQGNLQVGEPQPDFPVARYTWYAARLAALAHVVPHVVRGWVEVLGAESEAVLLHSPEDPVRLAGTMAAAGAALIVLAVMAWWCQHNTGRRLPADKRRTLAELCGLGIFRLYAGLLICTWVPFLLAEEGDKLAPAHLAIFMGGGKLLLGLAMGLCPVFGLLNDRTVHPMGRRRAWFLLGVLLLVVGITICALASNLGKADMYFLGVVIWTLGESVAESTTEALIPDYCPAEDYMKAAAVRSVMFTIGGMIGYTLIAVSVFAKQFHPSYIYVYYFVTLMITVPWNIYYACPTETEQRAIERAREGHTDQAEPAREDERSWWQTCYNDTFNASPYFRVVSIATIIQAAGSTTMMFISLILQDLVGLSTEREVRLHMSLLCIAVMVPMCITSSLLAMVGDQQNATSWMAIFIIAYSVTEICTPLTYYVPGDVTDRLTFLYGIAVLKGLAFGGIYSAMQPIAWSAIPAAWKEGAGSVSRATAWLSVCRSLGMGVGNFFVGVVLDFARQQFSTAGAHGPLRYPIGGWVTVHLFTALCCMASLLLLHHSVKLKGGVIVT